MIYTTCRAPRLPSPATSFDDPTDKKALRILFDARITQQQFSAI